VTINYPGASAQVVADTVAAPPIEQQVNGVEGIALHVLADGQRRLLHAGGYLRHRHRPGHGPGHGPKPGATGLAAAADLGPEPGHHHPQKTPDILNVINFYSPDGRYDDVYLSNFATIHIYDELLRIDGVSQINFLGVGNYSMRAWLDPQKLAALNMTAGDVANAVRSQNLDAPAGRAGPAAVQREGAVRAAHRHLGRLTTTKQFGDLIVKGRAGSATPAEQCAGHTLAMVTTASPFPAAAGPSKPG